MVFGGEKIGFGYFVGKIKTWLQRLQTYMSIINFILLFYLFIQENRWFNWYEWLIIIVVVCVVTLYVDVCHVMGNALGYQWDKNNAFKRLEKKVDTILKQMENQK